MKYNAIITSGELLILYTECHNLFSRYDILPEPLKN